jgi:phage antirepressor YoqD-like protein
MTSRSAALAQIEAAANSLTLREAAKELGQPERQFARWLHAIRWIYRLGGFGAWLGYADKEQAGYLEHTSHTCHDADGVLQNKPQIRIIATGLAKLAVLLNNAKNESA